MEYRLYYDDSGKVITYATSAENRGGQYIVVTREQFSECRMDVLVKDGKVIRTERNAFSFVLEKNQDGVQTSKYDINIPTEDMDDSNYWKITTHDHLGTGNIHN